MLAASIPLAEADVADMFEYMGQAVGADILVQRGRRAESYKAFKRLHWRLKWPQGEFFPTLNLPQGDFFRIGKVTACLAVLETFKCSANWLLIPTTAISSCISTTFSAI